MKVKSTELKTHLGRYLRAVEQDLTTIEVCIRDRTIAYLIPATNEGSRSPCEASPLLALKRVGVKVQSPTFPGEEVALSGPVLAGDGREDVVTTDEMRGGRDW